jgi:hypothetical protein
MRPDELSATEHRDGVAVRRELDDDVEIGVETLVAEFVAAGVATQDGPHVPPIDVDVDIADAPSSRPPGSFAQPSTSRYD